MFRLVYFSAAVRLFAREHLLDLLGQSRLRNTAESVTGLLLYHQGSFVQALEGPERSVRKVFGSIQADPRHQRVTTVLEETSPERQFPEWTMGFRFLDDPAERPPAYNDFLNTPWTGREFAENPSKCQQLLLSFKKYLR